MREITESVELKTLGSSAKRSSDSLGRPLDEPPCVIRTCFQRDVDRVTYSKAFRRLAHKTQVFLKPDGDHYRTRLTHTLEVMRIARTMARGLRLNEDLTEAIALGHDLGHTPFGHAGEGALNELLDEGFSHNEQSFRVVSRLERAGRGLNLCREVSDGILCHTGERQPITREGELVRFADRIAYVNHDFDDAVRAKLLSESDLPNWIRDCLGGSPRDRINSLVTDLVGCSTDKPEVMLSPERLKALNALREFMFDRVYFNPVAKSEESKGKALLCRLFEHFARHIDELPEEYRVIAEVEGGARAVADYIAGMTDRFAVMKYSELTIPKGWEKL